VNAIALGEGAAFGVDLWTKASVELTDEPLVIRGEITSDPAESTLLVEKTVARVFQYFGVETELRRSSLLQGLILCDEGCFWLFPNRS
jgi:shikimate kinase